VKRGLRLNVSSEGQFSVGLRGQSSSVDDRLGDTNDGARLP
jgi:hypothetical protein